LYGQFLLRGKGTHTVAQPRAWNWSSSARATLPSLRSDTSRPFEKPKSGRIALKVKTDLMDEHYGIVDIEDAKAVREL
jgi:hypothetical protein